MSEEEGRNERVRVMGERKEGRKQGTEKGAGERDRE